MSPRRLKLISDYSTQTLSIACINMQVLLTALECIVSLRNFYEPWGTLLSSRGARLAAEVTLALRSISAQQTICCRLTGSISGNKYCQHPTEE
jgi:hypothetical protein